MNWSNRITLIRIILTPVFVITLIQEMYFLPLLIFVLGVISDGLDGFIARKFNQKTKIGAFLDPAADKLLLVSAYLTLSVINEIPWWLTILIFSRDVFIISGWAVIFLLTESTSVTPRLLGKITTFFQMFTIIVVLMTKYIIFFKYIDILYYITGLVTIISGLDYLISSSKTISREGIE